MTYQKTIYLPNDVMPIWNSIPSNERNDLIQRALRDYAETIEIDPNLKKIKKLELELQQLEEMKQSVDVEIQTKKKQTWASNLKSTQHQD